MTLLKQTGGKTGMAINMGTYLVTGGAGFIGSNYIAYMLGRYAGQIKIINYDALTYAGNLENLRAVEALEGYVFVKGDVCDGALLRDVFSKHGIDYVIHFAAESHVDRSILNPETFVTTNVIGTATLLNAAMGAWKDDMGSKRFVQISTDEVYGSLGDTGYFTEETPLDAHSPYSASKAGADLLVKSYFDTYKMPVLITRCSNNYGPCQFPEKIIPLMINNALQGKPLPVYGNGLNVRDWLYVADHAKAIDMVTQKGRPGEVYNIGGHNERTNIGLVKTIIQTLRRLLPESDPRRGRISEGLITYVQDRKGHDFRYAIDPGKISGELGWRPETPFDEGIVLAAQWYLDNPQWLANVTSGAYA
jgi:dTDP-glucose 4,6-dehydratase